MPGRVKAGAGGGGGSSSGAPTDATYVVEDANGTLSAEVLTTTLLNSGTYASRPAASKAGRHYHATDINVVFRDNGSSWDVVYDPWGFKFFSDEGFITSTMAVEKAGLTTIPAADATILPAGATWTIFDSVGIVDGAATTGIAVAAWNLSAAKSRILVIANGIHCGTGNNLGLFVQETSLAGSDVDNAYMCVLTGSDSYGIYRESAGFTNLAAGEAMDITPDPADPVRGIALFYDDATDTIRGFTRVGGNTWARINNTSDTTFTTMATVGFRANINASGSLLRMFGPFLVFAA